MKRILIVLIMTFAGAFLFAQSNQIGMYNLMYDGSTTIAEKVIIIEQVLAAKPDGTTEFYANALHDLVTIYARQTDKNEINAADRAAVLLSRALGEVQYTDAGPDLWYICNNFNKNGQDTPLAKAAALEALGRVGATSFVPQVVVFLNNLNSNPPSNRDTQIQNERMAYGAILGLEYFRDIAGYTPVFNASQGWYSLRIRKQASDSLTRITDDPSDVLAGIIRTSGYVGISDTITTAEVKYEALRASENSHAPDSGKVKVAIAALEQGHNLRTTDLRQRETLATMRKLALNMIRRYGTNDLNAYPLIDRSYNDGAHDEKLAALTALAALGGEGSAQMLSGYLRDLHNRRTVGAGTQRQKQDEDSYVRVIIPALGNIGATGREYSAPVLRLVLNTNVWTVTVRDLAQDALQKIGN